MSYDHIQYGSDTGGEMVSGCCGASPVFTREYGGLITSAVECSVCRFSCTLVPNRAIDSDDSHLATESNRG